jgi:hypothetical protein
VRSWNRSGGNKVAKSRDDLRRELESLKTEIAATGIGRVSLVGHVRQAGVDGEDRAPGIYRDEDGVTVVVPPDRNEPTEQELRAYFPAERPRIWILLGPDPVEGPIEEVQP